MTLNRLFELDHKIGLCAERDLRVVSHTSGGLWPEGYYLLRGSALETVTQRQEVTTESLGDRVSDLDAARDTWKPDAQHCWCEVCRGSRMLMKTLTD